MKVLFYATKSYAQAVLRLQSQRAKNQPSHKGLAFDRLEKKCYTVVCDGDISQAVLEFFAVGGNRKAFLFQPVKGGGRLAKT